MARPTLQLFARKTAPPRTRKGSIWTRPAAAPPPVPPAKPRPTKTTTAEAVTETFPQHWCGPTPRPWLSKEAVPLWWRCP